MTSSRPVLFPFAAAVSVLLLNSVCSADDTTAADDDVRSAITRSVPYLQEHGASWIENRGCVSCHRIGMMTWSLTEAKRRGFDVDSAQLDEWVDWSLGALIAEDEKSERPVGARNPEGIGQMLFTRRAGADDSTHSETYTALVRLLVEGQNEVGLWKPGGQLPQQKRPTSETTQVSTLWNVLALIDSGIESEHISAAVEKTSQLTDRFSSGDSTEWYVTRLLHAVRRPMDDAVSVRITELRKLQQDDGGWGWIASEPADALATGMALYALRQAGVPKDDMSVQSAVRFLTTTQLEDGSWDVHGTKEASREEPEETAGYWGTAWATLGLLQTLPDVP